MLSPNTYWDSADYPLQQNIDYIVNALVALDKKNSPEAARAFVISFWNEAFSQGQLDEAFLNSGEDQ